MCRLEIKKMHFVVWKKEVEGEKEGTGQNDKERGLKASRWSIKKTGLI